MITYWPNKQSVDLNLAVSDLFTQTYQKFSFSVSNKTSRALPIDIFGEYIIEQLLLEILIELEVLIIDIIELNIGMQELKQLSNQILLHLANIAIKKLVRQLSIRDTHFHINFHLNYNKLFFHEHALIFKALMTYLIFGSEYIASNIFPFYNERTPFSHVKALFENIIIQAGNIAAFNLIENSQSMKGICSMIYSRNFANYSHQSIRKLSNFKNNLISDSLINLYIHYPQSIYCGKYRILLLSSKGIIHRYIYISRIRDYLKLSNYQLGSIIYLEIQDFILPRINQFITLVGKLILYVFIEIINKNLSISLRNIIKKFSARRY